VLSILLVDVDSDGESLTVAIAEITSVFESVTPAPSSAPLTTGPTVVAMSPLSLQE
jgi:hypothetical protein